MKVSFGDSPATNKSCHPGGEAASEAPAPAVPPPFAPAPGIRFAQLFGADGLWCAVFFKPCGKAWLWKRCNTYTK